MNITTTVIPREEVSNYTCPKRHDGVLMYTHVINESAKPVSYLDPVLGPMHVPNPYPRYARQESIVIMITIILTKEHDLLTALRPNPSLMKLFHEHATRIEHGDSVRHDLGIRINVYGLKPDTCYRDPVTGLYFGIGNIRWDIHLNDLVAQYRNAREYAYVTGIEVVSDKSDDKFVVYYDRVERVQSVDTARARKAPGIYISRVDKAGEISVIHNVDSSSCREDTGIIIFDTIIEAEDYLHQRRVIPTSTTKAKKATATEAPASGKNFAARLETRRRRKMEEQQARRAKAGTRDSGYDYDRYEPADRTRKNVLALIAGFLEFAFSYVINLTHKEGLGKWKKS